MTPPGSEEVRVALRQAQDKQAQTRPAQLFTSPALYQPSSCQVDEVTLVAAPRHSQGACSAQCVHSHHLQQAIECCQFPSQRVTCRLVQLVAAAVFTALLSEHDYGTALYLCFITATTGETIITPLTSASPRLAPPRPASPECTCPSSSRHQHSPSFALACPDIQWATETCRSARRRRASSRAFTSGYRSRGWRR